MGEPCLDRRSLLAAGGGAVGVTLFGALATSSSGQELPHAPPAFGGRIPVAFVMGNSSTMIDFAGPWEVFQDSNGPSGQAFYVYTVSDADAELNTTGNYVDGKLTGLRFRPDYTFANAPQPKIIMIGAQGEHTPAKINWIRKAAANADIVFSNCTGAFLLAKTGLLDGLTATTHHDFFDSFAKQFPRVKLVRDTRYIDHGKIITSGGLTSGIDGALHIVERILGGDAAAQVVEYMEYSGTGWKTRARS